MTMKYIGDVEEIMLEKPSLYPSSRLDEMFMWLGH